MQNYPLAFLNALHLFIYLFAQVDHLSFIM